MSETEIVYHLVFLLFSYCIIYPPTEFISIGLTINQLFAHLLGSEEIEFIQYHIRRTCLTLVAHSLLPFLYVISYYFKFDYIFESNTENVLKFFCWNAFVVFALIVPVFALAIAYYWYQNDWRNHPIARNLQKYCNRGTEWDRVAADINAEFRRTDKIATKPSAIHSVVGLENWVIKTSHYNVNIAHQSDTALVAVKSDSHDINDVSSESIQFVNIRVKPMRSGVSEFLIRINALDFKSLQDRMLRPITILSGVNFNKSVIDRFIEVFKEQISTNPKYKCSEMTDSCFACMQNAPNIKLQKHCLDTDAHGQPLTDSERCGNCYCRPMWCVDCMAKWFASRQNQYAKEVWLQQKCTCPMCRTPFCVLDVCYVETED